jgi:hypothetical protein
MITTPTLDDFNRADENPLSQSGAWSSTALGGGSWAGIWGGTTATLRLVSNLAGNQGGTGQSASFRTATIPAGDAQVWGIQSGATGSAEAMGLCLHLQDAGASGVDGYIARSVDVAGFPDVADIWRITNGTPTRIKLVQADHTHQGGRYLLFQRVGDDLELWLLPPGGDPDTDWELLADVADTIYTGGHLGLYCQTDDASWSGFGGGGPISFRPQVMRYQ